MAISDSFGNPLLLSLCKTSDDDDGDDDDNDVDVVESITSNDEFRVAYYLFVSYHYTSVRSRVLRTRRYAEKCMIVVRIYGNSPVIPNIG